MLPYVKFICRAYLNVGYPNRQLWEGYENRDNIHTTIYTIIKQKLELKKKSESWAIDTSAGVIFFDNSPLNK